MKLRLIVVSAMMATTMFAQGGGAGKKGGGKDAPPPVDTTAAVEHEMAFLTKYFALDSAQVPRITDIIKTEQKCLAGPAADLKRETDLMLKSMKDQMFSNLSDAIARHAKAEESATICRGEAVGGIYKLLSDAQIAKLKDGLVPLMSGTDNRFNPRQ